MIGAGILNLFELAAIGALYGFIVWGILLFLLLQGLNGLNGL